MTRNLYNLTLFAIIILTLSCKKKESESILGLDVQPKNDLVGVTITDSVSLWMHTQKVDSIRSYNDQYKFLGSTLDPVFGITHCGLYTNFSIANNLTNVTFGLNPVLDSAEIVIRSLQQFIGDTTTTLTFDIDTLSQKMVAGSSYYSSQALPKGRIGSMQAKYRIRGGVPALVLKLSSNLAQRILKDNAHLTNNTEFQNKYNGFYISTNNSAIFSPGSGGITRINLDDDISGVYMYYHDASTPATETTFQFTFKGSDALRFNHIEHIYSSGAIANLFDQINGDSLKGKNNVYLNCFGGTRARVYLPYLKNFTDSQNVSINRAELIIKIDESYGVSSKYAYPTNLALIGCNLSGAEELVWDQLETTDYIKYNATYDPVNKQYVFNIGRQVQKILTNKINNYGFYLVNADPNKAVTIRRDDRFNRCIIGGTNNLSYKPIFKITYIKFPYDK